jgi:hypothetical protein
MPAALHPFSDKPGIPFAFNGSMLYFIRNVFQIHHNGSIGMIGRFVAAIIIVVACAAPHAQAQQSQWFYPGKIGFGIDGVDSPNLMVKWFLSDVFALEIVAGADVSMQGGSAPAGTVKVNGVDVRGGLGMMFHLAPDRIAPYVGLQTVFLASREGGFLPSAPDFRNGLDAGLVAGLEFYMNQQFSMGLKQTAGVRMLFPRSRPNDDLDVGIFTRTRLTVRIYFN